MLLEINDLKAWYDELQILHGVSLKLEVDEIVSIVGSNGAGKTTLLKAIAGLVRSMKGVIKYNGKDVSKLSSHEMVELGVVLVPEGRLIFPGMTVQENLELGACTKRASPNKIRNMKKVFALMPILNERKNQIAETLSGGEQQLLAIGRGIMSEPTVLLLDEPSLGLSPLFTKEVLELVASIHKSERMGVIIVDQKVKDVLLMSERAYVMESGAIALEGNASEVLEDDRTVSAFLGR